MESFDFSFNNKYVRMWFIWVLPILILSVILFLLLPVNYQWIPMYLPVPVVIIFFCWYQLDKYKNRN
ncbi:hypothetical protein CYL18_17160 [Pradoshia eiseniae]|uniref:Uncharacterized protein n=1 Tax=Pradoshia eiseniae TaxID=2064768 RepID=A0A2S7MVX0_9BACI|nr:hypothetical protein CYL18_17160 [Pradoshia eiseniae]